MEFRKAKLEDILAIKTLYNSAKGTEYCTWSDSYPGDFEINEDFNSNNLYVLDNDNEIIGAISIVSENELDDLSNWTFKNNAIEFARVVIKNNYKGKGLSKLLIDGVVGEAKNRNKKVVHILVAKQNVPAQKLYKSAGFNFVGETFMFDTDFYMCEKEI